MLSYDHLRRARPTRGVALLAAGGVFAGSAVIGLVPTVAGASSHREAPLTASDPAIDNTDVYAFVDPHDPTMVNLIGNWIPFEEPNGGPNFYPWEAGASYDFHIDNDGDAIADLTYQWVFETQDLRGDGSTPRTDTFLYNNGPVSSLDDENLLFRQTYDLTVVDGDTGTSEVVLDDAPVAPSFTGPASMPDYAALRTEAITSLPGGGQSVATQADDSFFLDLRVFDLLYGADLSEVGQDTLAGYNVNTIALQVPADELALNGDATDNPVFGVWSTTSRASLRQANGLPAAGNDSLTQVSRLGQPLVNEVVIPAALKDTFNAISPAVDATVPAVVDRVVNPELPYLIEEIYGVTAPGTDGDPTTRDDANRLDLVEVFLTGISSQANGVDVDGDPATPNPIDVDLNSQALNADYTGGFQPSEMLRLNTAITGPTGLDGAPLEEASRLGVVGGDIQGFPNGRRLGDDVLDIAVFALEGVYDINAIPQDRLDAGVAALAAGDAVDANDVDFSHHFPYVALPNQESVNATNDGDGDGDGDGNGDGYGNGDGKGDGDENGNGNTPPSHPAGPGAGGAGGGGNGGIGTNAGGTAPVQQAAGTYPTGGVETGAGWDQALMPSLMGSVAALLLGAGAVSLFRSRVLRRADGLTTA